MLAANPASSINGDTLRRCAPPGKGFEQVLAHRGVVKHLSLDH